MPEGKYGAPYRRSRSTAATGHDKNSDKSYPTASGSSHKSYSTKSPSKSKHAKY